MSQYVLGEVGSEISAQVESQAQDAAGKAAAGIFSAAGDAVVKTAGGIFSAASKGIVSAVSPKSAPKPPPKKPPRAPPKTPTFTLPTGSNAQTRVTGYSSLQQQAKPTSNMPSTAVLALGAAAVVAAFLLIK